MISVSNVTKHFDEVHALSDVTLDIAEGEFVTIVGPSGCGKSTLLRVIAGLVSSHGSVSSPAKGAFVFQDAALLPWRTVQKNVELLMELESVPKPERAGKARSALSQVGLTGFEKSYPHQLSGGMKMRLSLARSLVLSPEYLLLDEPLSALDPFLRIKMRSELKTLQKKLGISFIHVTHSQDEAMALADMIVVMNKGKIEQVGDPYEVFNKPKNEFIANFVGGHNVISKNNKSYSIRMDHINVNFDNKNKDTYSMKVNEIEFQGQIVKVTGVTKNFGQLSVSLADDIFLQNKFDVNDEILINWDKTKENSLQ